MKNISKNIKVLIVLVVLIVSCLFLGFGYDMIHLDFKKKSSFEQDMTKRASYQEKNIFEINEILLFSSATATQNETINKASWNVNVSQFSDMAIFIDHHPENGLTAENTIKELYIDDIEYLESPTLGTPILYYKNEKDFGKLSYVEENKIENDLRYTIIPYDQEKDTSKPQIYDSSFSPICLGFVNENIKKNYTISDISTPLTYNGNILKRCNIGLNSIATRISFKLHIINQMDHHFVTAITLDIPLKNEDTTIYDGTLTRKITDFSNIKFYLSN